MTATRRIPVSEGVWEDISGLKRPGQTFDELLSHMVEQEKKRRFIEEMDRIEAEGDFVELDVDVLDTEQSQGSCEYPEFSPEKPPDCHGEAEDASRRSVPRQRER